MFRDPRFWPLAPLPATCIGTAWALQGLWAAPFMADVERLPIRRSFDHLFVMAVALSLGALLLGIVATDCRTTSRGTITLATAGTAFVVAETSVDRAAPIPSFALWAIIAVSGPRPCCYASLAEYYPRKLLDRRMPR